MTIEIALVISAVSLAFSIFQIVSNSRRNAKSDVKTDTTQLTTVIVKLENIGNDINEIKTDIRDVKDDIRNHSERLIRLEQQMKVLNKTVFDRKEDSDEN